MSKKSNIINNVISFAIPVGLIFFASWMIGGKFDVNTGYSILYFALSAILAGIVNAFAHELGHLIAGKTNGFSFISMRVWFLRWYKRCDKIRLSFCGLGEEAGYTEMVPTNTENLEKRYKKVTSGGIVASAIMTVLSILPYALYFLIKDGFTFGVLAMFLPISLYYLLGSLLPMVSEGVRNDGAVLYGLRKKDDHTKVEINLLSIHCGLFNGKTPSEIEESLYFDLPQLPEDDINFILLLNARYAYYLDKGDYEKAIKTTERLLSLEEYYGKGYLMVFKTDALYNACVIKKDEEEADELMYDVERYINKVNNATNIRAKIAYMLYVLKDKENIDVFEDKAIREINRVPLLGLAEFEKKLFLQLQEDF